MTVELFRCLNRLVQTGHIGRIGSDKFLSLIVTHRFFKILREHLFRRSKSGPFSAKAIRKKGRNAFLCCLCYFEKFRPFLVSRSQIEFVVRSMVEVAYRCFNEKVCRIWYGVCDMDKGNVEKREIAVKYTVGRRYDLRVHGSTAYRRFSFWLCLPAYSSEGDRLYQAGVSLLPTWFHRGTLSHNRQ